VYNGAPSSLVHGRQSLAGPPLAGAGEGLPYGRASILPNAGGGSGSSAPPHYPPPHHMGAGQPQGNSGVGVGEDVAGAASDPFRSMERVNPEEIRVEGQREGRAVTESVLPEDMLRSEEELARPVVYQSAAYEQKHANEVVTMAPPPPRRIDWRTDFVLNESRAMRLVNKVLPEMGVDINDKAIAALSHGIQGLVRSVIESSVSRNKRRRNTTALRCFENVDNLLGRNGEEVRPEARMNIAMAWGPDTGRNIYEDLCLQSPDALGALGTSISGVEEWWLKEVSRRHAASGLDVMWVRWYGRGSVVEVLSALHPYLHGLYSMRIELTTITPCLLASPRTRPLQVPTLPHPLPQPCRASPMSPGFLHASATTQS